ncbi:glucose-1-phosphate thymidylyltransferase [Reichenbachiella sp. 5M10]|uniref:GlmU family protein n=1 Tax=Reichenbachiella sp. 5M10 TaxID=1889772 RepID=UPI000C1554A0|nr:GlmU family protein [Reichenbachiella sp. 5M10]PIB36918.1 glucose-1-phosphate thymidylyltransferase [Reichenbachiella sp. 5M10]
MNIALIDLPSHRSKLFPLTLTRPIADLRIGILTIREKWEKRMQQKVSYLTHESLSELFPPQSDQFELLINACICPSDKLIQAILALHDETALYQGDLLIAVKGQFSLASHTIGQESKKIEYNEPIIHIHRAWDIFLRNAEEIKADFALLTAGRQSTPISDPHTIVYAPENVFIEEGVTIKAAILNAENGPIYLDKDSEIQEGAAIRGPFALGAGSRINMNAKIREGSTVGPGCKIGGEISNSVIYGNSNKAHDGFLGNSVLGEWCNLGADTNNSNLKNNYSPVEMWDEVSQSYIDTGLQFCGLIMGDHSKSAINTMFNTGTTVGVCSNIFGSGFPRKRIKSFTWGGDRSMMAYELDKAIETAEIVMQRKGKSCSLAMQALLKNIFDESQNKAS